MKSLLVAVLTVVVVTASAAIKEVAYVESTGAQWINTHYVPTCTDTFEMKVRFSALGFNQGLWCARGSDTAKNTMTCFAWQSDKILSRYDFSIGCQYWGEGTVVPYVGLGAEITGCVAAAVAGVILAVVAAVL